MLARLADFISRYSKLILAVWVVMMLVLVPASMKSFDRTDLSVFGLNEESSEAAQVIEKYFPGTGISENPMLVITYDSPYGKQQLELKNFSEYLVTWFEDYKKLDPQGGVHLMKTRMLDDSGIIVFGFTYKSDISFNDVVKDTGNLRSEIDKCVSGYLDDLGVKTKYFSTAVTGNSAICFDSGTDIYNTTTAVLVAVFVISIVLMGLFFGSVMTAVISTVSMAFSVILSMALMSQIATFVQIPMLVLLVSLAVCMAISFIHCILLISVYRRLVHYGVNSDEAVARTVMNAGRIFIISGLCILVCGLLFAMTDNIILRSLGISFSVLIFSVVLTSLIIPAVLMSVTKNELFWMRSSDGSYKSKFIGKHSEGMSNFAGRFSSFTDNFSRRGCIAIITVISLIAVASAGYVAVTNINSDSYDMTDSMITGESERGFKELDDWEYGGMFQPYGIVLESKQELGTINMPTILEQGKIIWSSTAKAAYKEITDLSDALYKCDPDNVSLVMSVEIWDSLVEQAIETGVLETDYEGIVNRIGEILQINDEPAYTAFAKEREYLRDRLHTYEDIVKNCGPQMDYAMNTYIGNIGYSTDDNGIGHINHICVSVFTKDPCTSQRAIQTTQAIEDTANSFIKQSNHFSKSLIAGVAKTYQVASDGITKYYVILVAIALVISFAIILIAERDLAAPLAIAVTSAIGATISTAIVCACLPLFPGGSSRIALMSIPIFSLAFSALFGYLQIAMMREYMSISEMKRTFNPVIIVASLIIALASLLLMFSALNFIGQLGFTLAVCILIDAFLVRILFSPAVWQFGVDHKIKFFDDYSH